EIADNTGIALFNTANQSQFTATNVLDAVGFVGVSAPYFMGTPLPVISASDGQYSFVRKVPVSGPNSGLPQDTNNNAADFLLVATDGNLTYSNAALGAPGPENLSSPRLTGSVTPSLVDPTSPSTIAPNRARIQCAQSGPSTGTPVCDQSNQDVAPLGFLSVRRKFVNNTGANVTRLRFRILDITNPTNQAGLGTFVADLRAITSPTSTTVNTGLGPIVIKGTTLEAPEQNMGGGVNSSLSAGTITLAAPLTPGSEINVQFLLGVRALGAFRFFVTVEALP
ncbi:MAG TPA: hypothetical protein VD966_13035, partial [Pyrinomonadaceae bacterium]|nr:hypothetical protein [Pyrinomonadaceae bacterium]